jgi:hypothetical protein
MNVTDRTGSSPAQEASPFGFGSLAAEVAAEPIVGFIDRRYGDFLTSE